MKPLPHIRETFASLDVDPRDFTNVIVSLAIGLLAFPLFASLGVDVASSNTVMFWAVAMGFSAFFVLDRLTR